MFHISHVAGCQCDMLPVTCYGILRNYMVIHYTPETLSAEETGLLTKYLHVSYNLQGQLYCKASLVRGKVRLHLVWLQHPQDWASLNKDHHMFLCISYEWRDAEETSDWTYKKIKYTSLVECVQWGDIYWTGCFWGFRSVFVCGCSGAVLGRTNKVKFCRTKL